VSDKIIYIRETSSTISFIKDLRQSIDVEEGTVVWTDFQTSGKGQRGNTWESENGKNLLFSTILYPGFIQANEPFLISQIVSVAIKNILDTYVSGISVKWPNDIYWKDKKICGTLIENTIVGNVITASEIGVGININQETFIGNLPNPVSLKQITNKNYDRTEIMTRIIEELEKLYNRAKTDKQPIVDSYKKSLYRGNGFFAYKDNQGVLFNACIENIEQSGILVLKTDEGIIRKFAFKEVRFL